MRPSYFAVILLASLLPGCAVAPTAAPVPAWEPPRWEQMRLAAKQARERGETAEAEQLCVAALHYVGASTIRSLDEYASLLKTLQRPEAEAAQARADMLREARSNPGPGSVYLGFAPFNELRAYGRLLREIGRIADADAVMALADAESYAQRLHFGRLLMQHQGRDPRGAC